MKISIIIPALNEAARLRHVLQQPALKNGQGCEVIVADGGSSDDTAGIAVAEGAVLVMAPRGRGQQLAAGAAAAAGDVLLFLHADTRLPDNALQQIATGLADASISGGNFALTFDGDTGFARWLTGYYRWLRSKGFYYGDSAIFIRRTDYDALGGIRPISLMEDYDLVRRIEAGCRTVCLAAPGAVTSSRRFAGRKPWRIFGQWVLLHLLFHLGVSPDRLARLYRSEKHQPVMSSQTS
ncbi:MAG: TIGR04283 family arsenosugar biosynthesis glycosyltransferase [Rhodospirillales bacterium]